jgi:hypothetical protein
MSYSMHDVEDRYELTTDERAAMERIARNDELASQPIAQAILAIAD